ncbi:unnamed protein product [Fraxinus pennsylvanica]|uniref:Uncharacterized protein n=1 Tax=Fraxinus pennsylvanica TaxID=56036 RepID=A0AAD2EEV6_9LAMI|nr:unnamed protein product [Fraxinus pennsylvanica]
MQLMQGLSEWHEHLIKHLKISAVGTTDQLYIEVTGQRLLSFAESLNFSFSFEAVYLTDMRNFKEDLLNVEAGETVVVYSFLMLRSMVSKPDCVENVMGAIRRLRPVLMVVIEVEAITILLHSWIASLRHSCFIVLISIAWKIAWSKAVNPE